MGNIESRVQKMAPDESQAGSHRPLNRTPGDRKTSFYTTVGPNSLTLTHRGGV